MATNISSISSNPVARVVAKRDGGSNQEADQFREELEKQESKTHHELPPLLGEQPSASAEPTPQASDGETGTQLDITG